MKTLNELRDDDGNLPENAESGKAIAYIDEDDEVICHTCANGDGVPAKQGIEITSSDVHNCADCGHLIGSDGGIDG